MWNPWVGDCMGTILREKGWFDRPIVDQAHRNSDFCIYGWIMVVLTLPCNFHSWKRSKKDKIGHFSQLGLKSMHGHN